MQTNYLPEPNVKILERYVTRLFQAFIDFTATPGDFEQLMESTPGSIDEVLHAYICNFTALEIAKMLYASSLGSRQELARRTWNLCLDADKKGNDPDLWYCKIPATVAAQIHTTWRVKGLKEQTNAAFAALAASIVLDAKGQPKEHPYISLTLQTDYIALRDEYSRAFDRMWFDKIMLNDLQDKIPPTPRTKPYARRPYSLP